MSTSRPLDLPVRLGRYILGPVVGIGGFAVVVRAHDESLDADVAIKILTQPHASDAEMRERFVREARLLRRVRNPSVVTVHDVGETDDGRPFLVMDFAVGGVLQDRLAHAVLPPDPDELRSVITTLTEGLGALHASGVIHRDIKPGNLLVLRDNAHPGPSAGLRGKLLANDERLVIADLGLAKDQLATAIGPTIVGGTPRFQAPEQTEVGGAIDARTDVYAATAVLWVLLTGRQPPNPDELPIELLGVDAVWRPMLARGMAAHPDDRFASMAEWSDAVIDDAPTVVAGRTGRTARTAAATTTTFPYKGLAAFQPEDAPLFFGRGELVDQLVARLQQRSTLVIGGPSGSGKSSLLRAGLLPALAGGALPGSQQWDVCLLTPGHRPMAALREQLRPFADGDDLAHLQGRVLIAVDQLEELFTLCDDADERDEFLRVLSAATSGAHPGARAVLAVRADFYGTCAAYPWLAEVINENQVLVGPMDRAQLREAIEGPARRVGLQLEDGLVERVLMDAGGDAGALPLVAHALVETWLRRDGNRLTVTGYEAAGGVAGAIGRTADHVFDQLDVDQRRAARTLLLRLVHPGDGTPDTKRLLTWKEVGDDEPTRLIVSRFADSRLLTADERGVQLAHEALLRSWGRLASWVDESRDELRAGERVEDAAREWDQQGRHQDLLYRGVPLAAALEWREQREGAVGEPTRSFLGAAETREHRARRLRRRALVVLVMLTVLALVTSAVAVVALGRSQRATRTAKAANRVASEQLARGLAASAIDVRASNPFLATVLAAEAMKRFEPPLAEARHALVESRIALAGSRLVPFGDPMPVGDALAVAVRPAGDIAATGNRDGSLALWDLTTHVQVGALTGPHEGIQSLAFTADGHWLIAGSADHQLWRWSIPDHLRLDGPLAGDVLAGLGSIVWAVTSAPSGTTVAAATQGGEVALIDAASGQALGDPLRPRAGELMSVAFTSDGATLLAGSGRGQVFVWSVASRRLRFPPVAAHTSHVWELLVQDARPPGRFVTVSSDATARVWDLRTGARLDDGPFDGGNKSVPVGVRGATLGADGETLALGGPDGALYLWSLADGRLVHTGAPAHRDRVLGAGRSTDALTLVTLGADRTLQVWTERPRPDPVTRLAHVNGATSSMAVSPDGRTLAVGTEDGTIRVLDAARGRQLARLIGHDGEVTALVFDGDGRLISGDRGGTLRAWDVDAARLENSRPGAHPGGVTSLAIDSRGRRAIVSGGADGTVARWDPTTLAPVGDRLGPVGAPVTDVAVSADGAMIAASTQRGDVARWTSAGRSAGTFMVTNDTVWALAFGPHDTLAAAAADETLSLWSLTGNGKPQRVQDLASHRGGALDVAFVDPETVAVTAGDGRVRLWDVTTGVSLGAGIEVTLGQLRYLATAPDGTIWTVDPKGLVSRIDALVLPAACEAAAASFDARQEERLLGDKPPLACTRG